MSVPNDNTAFASLSSGNGSLYFIGIGGIGMSAIARYFLSKGCKVSGYDKTATPLTRQLESEGGIIHYEDNPELIPKDVSLIVYTPAIPSSHSELTYLRENGYEVLKRSDMLKLITGNSFNVCVAGTHGKTTVSTMIAHILRHTGYGCNAFLGGVAANYNTNFWSSNNDTCVIEADEYDRSFLKLSPDVAVITATDADHLDIYGTPEEVENAFMQFSGNIKPGGYLLYKYGIRRSNDFQGGLKMSYSFENSGAEVYADKVTVHNGSYKFNVSAKEWSINNVVLTMGGLHNIENMVAAIAVARYLGIADQKIREAVEIFAGVKRRFEVVLKNERHILIDDYAHHPEELKALISGVKSLFDKKLVIVFQPHLYSRTSDLANEFAESLSMADTVILLPIYAARELPVQGVESEMILKKITSKAKWVMSKDEVKQWIENNRPELLVMAGAGDIDSLVQPVKEVLQSREV